MKNFIDLYVLRARAVPAVIAFAPAIVLLLAFVAKSSTSFMTKGVSASVVAGLLYALADVGRRSGKRIEEAIYKKMGGKPTTVMLRHDEGPFDEETKVRYFAFLTKQLGAARPTKEEELGDPQAADVFYERCIRWLREHSRDVLKFRILFDELNIYGMRRNLYGLRLMGLGTNAVVVALCLVQVYYGSWVWLDTWIGDIIPYILVFAIIHAAYLLCAATQKSVMDAARQYARQLIVSCEEFITLHAKDRVSRSRGNPMTSPPTLAPKQ